MTRLHGSMVYALLMMLAANGGHAIAPLDPARELLNAGELNAKADEDRLAAADAKRARRRRRRLNRTARAQGGTV